MLIMSENRNTAWYAFEGGVDERRALALFSNEEMFQSSLGAPNPEEVEHLTAFVEDLCWTKHRYDGTIRTYKKPNKNKLTLEADLDRLAEDSHSLGPMRINIHGVEQGTKITVLGNEFMRPGIYRYTDGLYVWHDSSFPWIYRIMSREGLIGDADKRITAQRPASGKDLRKVQETLLEAVLHEDLYDLPVQKKRYQRIGSFLQKYLV
jgi:hypothetical protein